MAKRGGFPGGMPGNMTNLMKQAQRMQRQMEEKTKELEEKEYTAAAGGGAVTVTVSGKKEVVSVKISPEAVDEDVLEKKERAGTDMRMCDIPCRMTAPNAFVAETKKHRKDAYFI